MMTQQDIDGITHSWKPHEVFIINQMGDATWLEASLFDSEIYDPIAAFTPRDGSEAILSVTRSGDTYRLLDREGGLVKEGASLPDVLVDAKMAGQVAATLAILPCGTHFFGR